MSRDLSRLFLAQNSIWQNGTPFHCFLEVAVIVIAMRLIGISFLWPGLFKLIFQKGKKFENRLMRGLGTRTKFRLFPLSISYSTKPEHRCLVAHPMTCMVLTSLIVSVFFSRTMAVSRSRDLICILLH